jgi:hypothetical protein
MSKMAHSALYDEDVVSWSEQQAEIIRRLRRSVRNLPNELDIENVAEEIESVGRSELSAVESFLRLLLLHLIKIASGPNSPAALYWREEARNFQAEAITRYQPSMAQRLDLQKAWGLARRQAIAALIDQNAAVPNLPEDCPFAIEELLRKSLDLDSLLPRVTSEAGAP